MAATLARRYLFKLGANMAAVPVFLLMEAILPRALGPRMYGDYSFATNLFQQFSGFLDMGSSTCYYNALSRNQSDIRLFSFFLRIALAIGILILGSSIILLFTPAGEWFMPSIPLWLAPYAALWAFLTWWGRVMRSTNDAIGATIPSEILRSVISLAGLAALGILYFAGLLNIYSLFLQQYFFLGVIIFACWLVTARYWRREGRKLSLSLPSIDFKRYSLEFFSYSHPLFIQALLSFFMLTAERWLLQWFDGSIQQGFFALSQKVSMACFLFVSAMTPLLMREFSVAWGKKDLEGMGRLLSRFAPLLYAIAAYFSCFTLVEGRALVEFFGGEEYLAATLAVQIMALYPLHQAYGQMATSVFHASGKTWIPRNVTALECFYGLAAAWFLLAPARWGGANLGAVGLALKTVGVQFFTVNLYLWLASRFLPFNFWRNLAGQIATVLAYLALAWGAKETSGLLIGHGHDFLRFFLSGIIYSAALGAIALAHPPFAGISRQEAKELGRRFLPRLYRH